MNEIKKIGILSFAKIQTILMAIMGLITGIFSVILETVVDVTGQTESLSLGFFAIIFFPIVYAILGFITGIVGGFLYNLVSNWIGGIKIEIQ